MIMRRLQLVGVAVIGILGAVAYQYWTDIKDGLTGTRCLRENEKAIYEVLEKGRPGKVRVSVIDIAASTTMWSRDLVHPTPDNVYPMRLNNCSFYLPVSNNYDYKDGKPLPGYTFSLWQFRYFADAEKLVAVLSENPTGEKGKTERRYSGSFFNVNSSEKYVVLERSYLGEDDYALVIKDIRTGKDAFVLTLDEVLKEHPNAAGSFDVGRWVTRPDGEYLRTFIYDGVRDVAYVYVKAGTWETEVYDVPSDMLAGVEVAIPPFAPILAYTDVIVWAGIYEVTQALIDEQISSGQKKHLIVANLKTGKKVVIETAPIIRGHRFKLTWLSDTELQYTMPDGTTKTYRIE